MRKIGQTGKMLKAEAKQKEVQLQNLGWRLNNGEILSVEIKTLKALGEEMYALRINLELIKRIREIPPDAIKRLSKEHWVEEKARMRKAVIREFEAERKKLNNDLAFFTGVNPGKALTLMSKLGLK